MCACVCFVRTCVHVCVHACMLVCRGGGGSVCAIGCAHVLMCASVYVCVCVCVCVREREREDAER